jgi:dihydroflavonol-4-reductase
MILVTGATGFIGSAVVRHLLARNEQVRVLVRADADRRNIDGLPVHIVTGDLQDPSSLDAAVKGCAAVFHLAADYRLWVRDAAAMFQTNVEGSRALVRAAWAAGAARIVYTSSVAVLGHVPGGCADERTPVRYADMIGPYKQSKFRAEGAVRELIDAGAPVVIVNPSLPMGPRDSKPTPTGRMIVEAMRGKVPAYVDTGLNAVHVDDVAEGHMLALDRGVIGERYILGGDNLTLAEILALIAGQVGRKPPRVRLPHGVVLPVAVVAEAWTRLSGGQTPFVTIDAVRMARKRMFFVSSKAKAELGYSPRPAARAVADAVRWFRDHGYG